MTIKTEAMNTQTTANGKTLYRVAIDGADYGFMSSRARRQLIERLTGAKN